LSDDAGSFSIREGSDTRFTITTNGDVQLQERLTFSGTNNTTATATINLHSNNYLYITGGTTGLALTAEGGSDAIKITDGGGTGAISFEVGNTQRFKLDANSRISLTNNDSGASNTIFGYLAGDDIASGGNYNCLFGQQAGADITTGEKNVAYGYQALFAHTDGDRNVAIGYGALMALDGTESRNIGIGYLAGDSLNNNATVDNIFIGDSAGRAGTGEVIGCVGVGTGVMQSIGANNHTGSTGLGHLALGKLTSGTSNTAIGYEAGNNNTTGGLNTFVGYFAGHGNDSTALTGNWNTCIGEEAGYLLEGAANANTLVGQGAGDSITTGDENTCIGRVADVSGSTAQNQLVLGYGATGTGDDEVAIGNTSITAIKAQVTSITAYSSDERTKKDIQDYDLKGLDFIKDLQLKTYIYKNPADFPDEIRSSKWDEEGVEKPADPIETQVGLTYAPTQDSGIKTLTYGNLIFPLIKAVQELSAKVTELEKK
jgi:hypothetical protein